LRKGAGRRDPAQALFEDANRHVRAGRIARARQLARQGMQMFPGLAAFWGLAGALALLERDWAAADAELTRAHTLGRDDPYLIANLAAAKAGRGDFAAAAPLFEAALSMRPDEPKFRTGLADALARDGRPEKALALFAHPCTGEPADLQGRCDLGLALIEGGQNDDAGELLAAIPPEVRDDEVYRLLATIAGKSCKIDDVLRLLRTPIAGRAPSWGRESSALFSAHYDESETDESLLERHKAFGARFPDPPPRRPKPLRARLRVGFLSPDFKNHSVARFFLALARGRTSASMEIVCFSDVGNADSVTQAVRGLSDRWRDVFGRDDNTVAAAIREEAPDILIDLAGHTGANRMSLLATRPAANQATWLGYPDTTGLKSMDVRLVDAITDPPGRADSMAIEKLVRIDGCFVCFAADQVRPQALPRQDGPPVFGSFNVLEKLGPSTIALWARVLAAAPGSRLLLKTKALDDPELRRWITAAFESHGIAPDRLDLRGYVKGAKDHLAAYAEMDVALDPLLYNGTTTTCEALSMGVPVVTLPGTRHAARVGASLLTAAGLTDGLAASADDYVARAVELAKDRTRDRTAMRAKFESSALCDAPDFARRFEAALRSAFT
jgi:protein O-GlcNAc transferase